MTEVNRSEFMRKWMTVEGVVCPGHRVASGLAADTPYPQGTIEMQAPFFRQLGLDLRPYYLGTLNVTIRPYQFRVKQPEYRFEQVKWSPEHEAESFSFSRFQVVFANDLYEGLIYYPHPETKIGHFQDPSTLEVLAPPIPQIGYGDRLQIRVNVNEIEVLRC